MESSAQSNGPLPSARMYLSVVVVMLGAIVFGLDLGNFSNVQAYPEFLMVWCVGNNFGDTDTCGVNPGSSSDGNQAWLAFLSWAQTMIAIGAACGAFFMGPVLSSKCGRRLCISVGSTVVFVGSLGTSCFSFEKASIFMCGRFLSGFGVGTCIFALPIYNSEIATPAIRGFTGSLMELYTLTGVFAANCLTYLIKDWQFGMLLPGVAAVIVAIAVWTTPESPRYLMVRHGYDSAVAALQKVRRGDVVREAEQIRAQVESEAFVGQVPYGMIFRDRSLRMRVFVACGLNIAQQTSGVNVFVAFGARFFNSVGLEDPFLANLVCSASGWLGILTSLCLIDSRWGGRRALLLLGCVLVTLPLVVTAIATTRAWPGVISLLCVCFYNFANELALQPIPQLYPSEIFTVAERERALSLAASSQYISQVAILKLGPYLIDWSKSGMCVIFAAANVVNLVFVAVCVKETKSVPLEQVPALFSPAGKPPLSSS